MRGVSIRVAVMNDLAKIEYYQMVNKFGRSQASHIGLKKAEMVGLLCEVASFDSANSQVTGTGRSDPMQGPVFENARSKHNIQHGLLRCNPLAWCLEKET